MTQVFIGIDYSMVSPAICIHTGETWDFKNCKFHFLTSRDSHIGKFLSGQIEGRQSPQNYKTQIERFSGISDWALSVVGSVEELWIEGYSMGSRNGLTFNIAENGGILKFKLFERNIKFNEVPPTAVKKFASKKKGGKAKKSDMYEAFLEETGIHLQGHFSKGKIIGNPVSDLVDAYFIAKYGYISKQNT